MDNDECTVPYGDGERIRVQDCACGKCDNIRTKIAMRLIVDCAKEYPPGEVPSFTEIVVWLSNRE